MKIAVVNMSALDDVEVGSMVAEMMQKHEALFERFAIEVFFVSKTKEPQPEATKLVIVEDESENPDWGEVVRSKNLGFARIFSATCMENGTSVAEKIEEQVLTLVDDASVPDPGVEGSRGDGQQQEVARGDPSESSGAVEEPRSKRKARRKVRDVPGGTDAGGGEGGVQRT
jgi:hypothetical protein